MGAPCDKTIEFTLVRGAAMRNFVSKMLLAGLTAAGAAAGAADLQSISLPGCCREKEDEEGDDKPRQSGPGEEPRTIAGRLFRDGPGQSVPADRPLDNVQGFVRDGWPVVVDFEPEPGTRTDLRVSIYERDRMYLPRRVRLIMDPSGRGGRQLFTGRLEMPPGLWPGRAVGIAQFEVISRRLDGAGRRTKERAPVEVYGIGAGPRAVGSISVTNVVFAPPSRSLRLPRKGGIATTYGYVLKQPFDLVAEDVWRSCKKVLCKELMSSKRVPLSKQSGPTRPYRLTRPGTYRLNVRAWLSCPNANFTLCGDGAAWAIGRSAPVLVEP
jgi:hypothetical protein